MNPYFWQALGEELWRLLREFFQKKPLVATATCACSGIVLYLFLTMSATLLPKRTAPPTTEVSGVLRVDGVPVSEGVIQFLPKRQSLLQRDRRPAVTIIRNGEFKSQDVQAGPYRVVCFSTREVEKKKKKRGEEAAGFPERISIIPEKYRDGVEVSIQSGKNEVTLDWKSE